MTKPIKRHRLSSALAVSEADGNLCLLLAKHCPICIVKNVYISTTISIFGVTFINKLKADIAVLFSGKM